MGLKRIASATIVATLVSGLLMLTACGGGGGGSTSPSATPAANTLAVVNMGDAVVDSVASFELTITQVSLNRTDGTSFTLFTGTRRVEVSHASGVFEPFALVSNVPQGTYTSATVNFSSVQAKLVLAAIPPALPTIVEREDPTARTSTITFTTPLTVGATPPVLNFDLNVAAFFDAGGNLIAPNANALFAFLSNNLPSGREPNEVEEGEFEHIVGKVTAVSAPNFTISRGQSDLTLNFATDTATKFEINDAAATSVAALVTGMLVRVEGRTQPNGTLLAKEVEAFGLGGVLGMEAEGLVVETFIGAPPVAGNPGAANPVTQFKMIVHDGSGPGITSSATFLGGRVTVNVDTNTSFRVDNGKLSVPSTFLFDATHFSKGQKVEAETENQLEPETGDNTSAGLIRVSKKVKLEPQTLAGTLTPSSATQFLVTVDTDSAFARLTGQTTIAVTTQSATQLKDTVDITTAGRVRVRGLLFADTSTTPTTYRMLATRVRKP
jgi:Domain of unknown function (DUF5666)